MFRAELFTLLLISYAVSSLPTAVVPMGRIVFSLLLWGQYCLALLITNCHG